MTRRSERSARDPAHQASVWSQVAISPTISPHHLFIYICFLILGFLSETQLFLVSACSPPFGFSKLKEFLALLYSVCRAVMLLGELLTGVLGLVWIFLSDLGYFSLCGLRWTCHVEHAWSSVPDQVASGDVPRAPLRKMSRGIWAMDSLYLMITLSSPMGVYATNLEFPVGSHLRELMQRSLKRKMSPFVWETSTVTVFYCIELLLYRTIFFMLWFFFPTSGISATSEDIPNKIEDLRSECSSDFGGKDSVTSPDGEESGHGRRLSHPC